MQITWYLILAHYGRGPVFARLPRSTGMPPAWSRAMTIKQPSNDELPATPPGDDQDDRDDPTSEPEQRAPGPDQMPVGAPRDEPDPEG